MAPLNGVADAVTACCDAPVRCQCAAFLYSVSRPSVEPAPGMHCVQVEAGAVSSPQRAASGAANMDVSPGPAPAGQVPMELGTPYVAVLTAAAPPAAAPPAPAAESSGGMVGPVQPQTPYNMPYTIFEAVVRSNMDIRYRHRLYDRQYFRCAAASWRGTSGIWPGHARHSGTGTLPLLVTPAACLLASGGAVLAMLSGLAPWAAPQSPLACYQSCAAPSHQPVPLPTGSCAS